MTSCTYALSILEFILINKLARNKFLISFSPQISSYKLAFVKSATNKFCIWCLSKIIEKSFFRDISDIADPSGASQYTHTQCEDGAREVNNIRAPEIII